MKRRGDAVRPVGFSPPDRVRGPARASGARTPAVLLAAGLALVAVLPVAACDRTSGTGSESASSGGTISSAPATAAEGLPSGIVATRIDRSAGVTRLFVYDLGTGGTLGTASVRDTSGTLTRDNFDAALRNVVYAIGCDLQLATLTGDHFEPTARWAAPEAGFGSTKPCFRRPTFHPDGSIRALIRDEAKGEAATLPGAPADRQVSVDPARPDVPPRDEGPVPARKLVNHKVLGATADSAAVYLRDTTVDHVDYENYRCAQHVDETRLLCATTGSVGRQGGQGSYGSVALVSVDRSAKTVTFQQVAPPTRTFPVVPILGPDRRQVAIHDDSGWYLTTIDGAAAPAKQPLDVAISGSFWA